MRYALIFLALLFSAVPAGAQPFTGSVDGYRLVTLNYQNSSGEKGVSTFLYTNGQRPYKAFWTLADSSRYSENYYQYDRLGQAISAFRVFSDGKTSSELFRYDHHGNKIAETFFRSDSVQGAADYVYHNGRLQKAIYRNHKGWLNGTVTYQYDDKNHRVSGTLTRNNQPVCTICFDYDDVGNCIFEKWNFQGKWEQEFRYHYEPVSGKRNYYASPFLTSNSRLRVKEESYTWNGEKGGPSIYNYDDMGRLAQKTFVRSDSFQTRTNYQYASDGRLIASRRQYPNGQTTRFEYHYNEYEQLISRQYFQADSLIAYENYGYDAAGKLDWACFQNMDGWLTGSITFCHDALNRVVAGVFRGSEGYDADLQFRYDDNGCLRELRWDFSFGKYQQYNFTWEEMPRVF